MYNNTTVVIPLSDMFEVDLHRFRIVMNSLGLIFSLVGYGVMVTTAFVFPVWRRTQQNQLWLHMCGSFIVYFSMHFYTYAFPIDNQDISVVVEHVNKYVVRVSVCWMLAGAWLTYKSLVDVFSDIDDKFMYKAALFSYICPIPFVVGMYVLYLLHHYEYTGGGKIKIGCNLYQQGEVDYLDTCFILNCIFDNFLLVIPIIGSLALYIMVTISICSNRKLNGRERDLCGTVALGFYFVFTCCVQCAIITAKFIFALTGFWSYITVVLMSFHVSTYTILFIFCNKMTRQSWCKFLKDKIHKKSDSKKEFIYP